MISYYYESILMHALVSAVLDSKISLFEVTCYFPNIHVFVKDLTFLPAVSPSLKILDGLCFDDFHMFLKMSDVQSGLQHLLLLHKDLQNIKESGNCICKSTFLDLINSPEFIMVFSIV